MGRVEVPGSVRGLLPLLVEDGPVLALDAIRFCRVRFDVGRRADGISLAYIRAGELLGLFDLTLSKLRMSCRAVAHSEASISTNSRPFSLRL